MRTDIVSAAVIIEKGKVLLSRRKKGTHLADRWEFPGGKAEPGEDPRAALRRELEEELGIIATATEIVDVTFHRYDATAGGAGNPAGFPGEDKAVLLLFFQASRDPNSPEPKALDVADFKWADATDLDPSEFPPADVAILKKVRALLP